tara:strand:- start:88 stop:561 length:474 start_codon:yes stop_codon:yes gene_type:complete
MIITVFLVVLVVSLILGNLLLSLLKPKLAPAGHSVTPAIQKPSSNSFKPNTAPNNQSNKQSLFSITNRIDRVEKLLLRANAPKFIGKKLDSTVLGRKMNDFTEFKTNTKVEIEALKEDVARLKNELGVMEKKRPGEDFEISDDKLHNLVFRSGANKG